MATGWDSYIVNLTSQGVTHAGIFGVDGSRWAASSSFPTVANLKEDLPKVFSTDNPQGLVVNNEKYIFIRNIGNAAVLRKGADGMVVTKTNQAYIISIGVNQKPEALVKATTNMGDYLKGCGY